jgi:exosortase/archaeosortase family protein
MLARLRHPGWLIVAQLAAFWPVWCWYVSRMTDGSDEPLGILALITVLVLAGREERKVLYEGDLIFSTLLMLLYAVSYPFIPPLLRAIIAVTALSLSLSSLLWGIRFHFALTGLVLLSLPVVSTLQFYLGYPMRMLCGYIALPMLSLSGFPVILEGTNLRCGDFLVSIDAPCSGIKMLWTGLYLTLVLVCLYRVKTGTAFLSCGISWVLLILANTLRTTTLFLLEVLPIDRPAWLHDLTGLIIFTLMGLALIAVVRHLSGERPCATPVSS